MASLRDLFPAQLHTPRLILDLFDPSNEEHYECFLASMNSATAHTRMGDFGVRTRAQFDAFGSKARLHDPRFRNGLADTYASYVARLREGPVKWMGGVSLAQRVVNNGTVVLPPDIGWAMLEEFMGKGYATEAAMELLRWARDDFKVEKGIIVFPSATNRQSNRVAEKLGFVPGGECKDLDRPGKTYSLWILPGMERIDDMLKDGIGFRLE